MLRSVRPVTLDINVVFPDPVMLRKVTSKHYQRGQDRGKTAAYGGNLPHDSNEQVLTCPKSLNYGFGIL